MCPTINIIRQNFNTDPIITYILLKCKHIFRKFVLDSIFFVSKSKATDEVISFKYYTSVEVEYGDTLWGIASNYMTEEYRSLQDYIEEIKTLNGLQSDMIRSGQFLVIPYYSSE